MSNTFLISDTHFGHTNSWEKFKRSDGRPLRDFSSTEEMDEHMVERWNSVVGKNDVVYHLGDVVIHRRALPIIKRLNGRKKLVMGNHDIFKNKDYYDAGFEELYGVRVFVDKFILSHIPLHPESISQRFKVNVHGHLHFGEVKKTKNFGSWEPGRMPDTIEQITDPRYMCVSVEMVNYTPISFDDAEVIIAKRFEEDQNMLTFEPKILKPFEW